MTVATFGVVSADIQAQFFPNTTAFSSSTTPTTAAVLVMVNAEAAVLTGRLAMQGISTGSLTDTATAYYAWCADTIRLGAAIRVARAMAGPGLDTTGWEQELDQRYTELQRFGYLALGDAPAPSPSTAGVGPRTHILEHSLDIGDLNDISTVAPRFRRDDEL